MGEEVLLVSNNTPEITNLKLTELSIKGKQPHIPCSKEPEFSESVHVSLWQNLNSTSQFCCGFGSESKGCTLRCLKEIFM